MKKVKTTITATFSSLGGGKKLAKKFDVDFLGSVPIDSKLREQEDKGLEQVFEPFREIDRRIYEKLNKK